MGGHTGHKIVRLVMSPSHLTGLQTDERNEQMNGVHDFFSLVVLNEPRIGKMI